MGVAKESQPMMILADFFLSYFLQMSHTLAHRGNNFADERKYERFSESF
jgi:hypothetical protein